MAFWPCYEPHQSNHFLHEYDDLAWLLPGTWLPLVSKAAGNLAVWVDGAVRRGHNPPRGEKGGSEVSVF